MSVQLHEANALSFGVFGPNRPFATVQFHDTSFPKAGLGALRSILDWRTDNLRTNPALCIKRTKV
ncbi:hypothetical protein ROA7745_03849 [Roseovarius aestuarii]|uniref:Uncharacterized protein n=1 Tax=Roseovarius aestuarii TaxID=475083 RepID=A0A1X7BWH0_9RHOB|nr:hypothetical protein ROA7745_03849 [Roseovarius aestuarii]